MLGHGLTTDEQTALLSTDPGFDPSSIYSASYLNSSETYQDLGLTYGHLANSSTAQNWITGANGQPVQQTVAIDAKARPGVNSGWEVFTHGGRNETGLDAIEWGLRMQEAGAGEILLTSMDQDGTKQGLSLIHI